LQTGPAFERARSVWALPAYSAQALSLPSHDQLLRLHQLRDVWLTELELAQRCVCSNRRQDHVSSTLAADGVVREIQRVERRALSECSEERPHACVAEAENQK